MRNEAMNDEEKEMKREVPNSITVKRAGERGQTQSELTSIFFILSLSPSHALIHEREGWQRREKEQEREMGRREERSQSPLSH